MAGLTLHGHSSDSPRFAHRTMLRAGNARMLSFSKCRDD